MELMTTTHQVTRRAAVQSLLLLPGTIALATQEPSPADKDRALWNNVYSEEESRVTNYPNRFLADVVQGRTPGRALDIGMGQGRNSLFLARLGWDVTGVDISDKGIEIAKKDAEKTGVKVNCVVADFPSFEIGKEQWDLIAGIYMGGLILTHAKHIAAGLKSGGFLVVENFHRDINVNALAGGKLGYPVNALLETFVPLLRIVQYEEVFDFPDWSNHGQKVPLVRMLARKG
jgi:SAM-dependent methyltransferase